MASFDHIDDEEKLHDLMMSVESTEERKAIRQRLKDIREKQRVEMEARRQQREKETEDLVRKKFEMAEAEKKRKMAAYGAQKPMCERDSDYQATQQKMLTDRHKQAEQEKQKRLDAYKNIAQKEHQVADASKAQVQAAVGKAPEKPADTGPKQTAGFGGVQYGAAKPKAKPQGARGAMAAFKGMDAAANPGAPKPNKAMARSPSAIKTMLLEWCKAMTREYENIEVTNFSSSWNNGLAFCALIHHFYPDSFDYSQLDPKNRRYNFELAFNTAEKLADISPLLDVEDMVKMKNPDWKCVFTYVQSFYRHLRDHENNKAKAPPVEA